MIETVKYNTHAGKGYFFAIKKVPGVDLRKFVLYHNVAGPAICVPNYIMRGANGYVANIQEERRYYFFGVEIKEVPEMPLTDLEAAIIAYQILLAIKKNAYPYPNYEDKIERQIKCIEMYVYHAHGAHALSNLQFMACL